VAGRSEEQTQITISERKRTVTYTKPHVAVPGNAVHMIESERIDKGTHRLFLILRPKVNPVYDLDA